MKSGELGGGGENLDFSSGLTSMGPIEVAYCIPGGVPAALVA